MPGSYRLKLLVFWSTCHYLVTVTLYYSMTTCTHSWVPHTPETAGLLRKDNTLILDPSYPELVCVLEAILVSSDKWCGQHIHLTWAHSNTFWTWFACKILPLQISGRLWRDIDSKFLQRYSNHLWNGCHRQPIYFPISV